MNIMLRLNLVYTPVPDTNMTLFITSCSTSVNLSYIPSRPNIFGSARRTSHICGVREHGSLRVFGTMVKQVPYIAIDYK